MSFDIYKSRENNDMSKKVLFKKILNQILKNYFENFT